MTENFLKSGCDSASGATPAVHPPLQQLAEDAPWNTKPHWYAVQTLPRYEKKVAAQLEQKGIPLFLPLIREIHRWSDRRKIVEVPLFPGYTFVHIPWSTRERLAVLQSSGVIRMVSSGCEPLPIEDKQVEDIKLLLTHNVPLTPYPYLKAGQRVRIRGGCLDGVEGILVARKSSSSFVVTVEAIQRSLAISVEGYELEPA
jgi:transcription antitermination factor NusG